MRLDPHEVRSFISRVAPGDGDRNLTRILSAAMATRSWRLPLRVRVSTSRKGPRLSISAPESARTNRGPITEAEEVALLRELRRALAGVARGVCVVGGPAAALHQHLAAGRRARGASRMGGDILNDIGALPTDENARICAETGAALLIMHSVGAAEGAAYACGI